MRADRFPLSYDECRDRFRWAARQASADLHAYPISTPGPSGQQLTIEVATVGPVSARRVLLVMGGVHGDEGSVASVLQCDAIGRWAHADRTIGERAVDSWPTDVAAVLVHGINPWGMCMWRRQNESNVDLNRNWNRSNRWPSVNTRYSQLHDALCPGPGPPPDADTFLARTRELIELHGYQWVKAAVTEGQYSHPDGLYFGGDRTEESVATLSTIVAEHLAAAEEVLVVDLHTGHGEYGTYTLLSTASLGSDDDRWLRGAFDPEHIETTAADAANDDPGASSPKLGQLAIGLAGLVPTARWRSVTMELGTCSDTRMILAERAEHWVHLHGDRNDAAHAAIVWEHRCCSCPDDPTWEAGALAHGRTVLDAALAAASG